MSVSVPHPIPYQGSKRNLAAQIMAHFPPDSARLIEPFAGSAALSLASAAYGKIPNLVWQGQAEVDIFLRLHQLADHRKMPLAEYIKKLLHETEDS